MITLYHHQLEVLNQTKEKNKVAYFLDMGLGKTFVGSEKAMSFGETIVLICQKSKINDWINHFETYYSDEPHFVEVSDLTKKDSIEDFIKLVNEVNEPNWLVDELTGIEYADSPLDPRIPVGVINYELAWRRPDLLKLKDFTLMLDESSLIQNSSAKQSKFILKLGLNASNVILLSGTPCSGKYENLWTQAKLLGWEISEKLYKEQFIEYDFLKNHYGKKFINPVNGRPIKIVVGYKNEERLKRKLRENGAVFMKTDEVFDLPKQNYIDVNVDVTSYYTKFVKNNLVTINGVDLVGTSTLTKMLYLRMLCGQFNDSKIEALKDLILSTNDRLIIFYNFNDELDILIELCKKLDRPYSQVNGKVKDLEAYESISSSITLCQYQAASKGLNLQKANKIIYFTPTQSVENWMQSQKRIHRIGQGKPCFYYLLKCKGSIEDKIYQALERGVDYTNELFKEHFN